MARIRKHTFAFWACPSGRESKCVFNDFFFFSISSFLDKYSIDYIVGRLFFVCLHSFVLDMYVCVFAVCVHFIHYSFSYFFFFVFFIYRTRSTFYGTSTNERMCFSACVPKFFFYRDSIAELSMYLRFT